ncbi:hypothetical protein GYMLUDRAFT_86225 [Collybiopsis luxurians FD-317 M1]|uniref:Unplaced genomic scaffold GYMLUscaffold_36, whole genome shotgun sequence n=1 Tax=Collybiopsis luxurians FD-317 M1 TaxID=944289 RepID=A0A0D0CSG4_9AGAR|nr:hypothetical protein GYMLUDRAFT_86225 [Collybiopsis luxurians FD-317 M1]
MTSYRFSSRPNLHSVWHRSYAGTFLLFDKIAPYIPHVSVIPWQGPWDGEDKVYFPPNVRALRHEYRSVRKGEIGLEDWILRKKKLFGQLMEHAAACSRWQKESHDLRAKDLQLTRSRRKGAIFEKLRDLGWGEEIHRLETDGNGVLSSHKDVRQSKDLTDKAWFRIQPRLVRVLEDARSQRLEEEHSA